MAFEKLLLLTKWGYSYLIEGMGKGARMNIVYVANEKYVQHLCISMLSLLDHHRGKEELRLYIISTGIKEASQKILRDAALLYKREICILDFADIAEKFSYKPDTSRFDIAALGRLFLGELLPAEAERVLYLDCDTLVLQNLEALYAVDLKGKLLGAVPEPTIYPSSKTDIGMYKERLYYNSGVLLADLAQWRKTRATETVLAYLESINEVCLFADQDAINGAFMQRIRTLSPKYNFFSNYPYWRYEALLRLAPEYGVIPKAVFEQAKKHPAILHFAGDERPWKRGNLNYYRRAYEKYKRLSPFADAPPEPANICYMFAYHLMNLATFVCPGLRVWLSRQWLRKIKREKRNYANGR